MVIWTEFRMRQNRDPYRKDAPPILLIESVDGRYWAI